MEVRTRIAPSPTGFPHLGFVFQALFNDVFSKTFKGVWLLRIEDTDRTRFVEGAEKIIQDSLKWIGLIPDEGPDIGGEFGPYRQSERLDLYKKYTEQILEKSYAYRCFCTKERLEEMRNTQQSQGKPPMYDRTCLRLSPDQIEAKIKEKIPFAIRMKIPENRIIKYYDAIVGDVEFDSNLVDDQVILKSDSFPTYHLAVVVDDHLMQITHIFRGTEWLPSTPKHVLLYEYLGWDMPHYIHLPLLLNSDGKGKLSKRHGHASLDFYKKEGYLPEAILNYLANIVWNHPEGKELFEIMEFGKAFQLDPLKVNVKSTGVRFDLQKLEWMNGEYIRKMSDEELTKRLQEFLVDHPSKDKMAPIMPLVKERIKKLSDFIPLVDFLFSKPEYEKEVFEKVAVQDKERLKDVFSAVLSTLEKLSRPWNSQDFESSFRELAKELGLSVSQMFQLIRIAVSGKIVTPPLFESIQILGEEETLERIKLANNLF